VAGGYALTGLPSHSALCREVFTLFMRLSLPDKADCVGVEVAADGETRSAKRQDCAPARIRRHIGGWPACLGIGLEPHRTQQGIYPSNVRRLVHSALHQRARQPVPPSRSRPSLMNRTKRRSVPTRGATSAY